MRQEEIVSDTVKMDSERFTPFMKQSWVVSGILLIMISQGMMHGFLVSLIPVLKNPDADIKVDLNTLSWIASCVGIANIPGFIISPIFMDMFGRRTSQILAIIPGILGWITICLSQSSITLVIGRILTGYTVGASTVLGAVIIGEYTSPTHRGIFLNLKSTSVCVGIMFCHFLDQFCSWKNIALIASGLYVASLLIIFTWPESPVWLATKGRYEDSEDAFIWLRGTSTEEMQEFNEMIKVQKQKKAVETHSFLNRKSIKIVKEKIFYKPILIIALGMIILEVSGRHLFPAYATEIISQITGKKLNSVYYTLGIDLVVVLSSAASAVVIKLTKRRKFLFASAFPAVIVLFINSFYLILVSKRVISPEYTLIPITLLVMYFILANLGCSTLPLVFFGELLPLAYRRTGAILGGVTGAFFLYATLHVSPYLLENIKIHGTFTVLGCILSVCLFILYFIMPETKDKSLQEIENYFIYSKFKIDEDVNDIMIPNDDTEDTKSINDL